MTFAVAVSHDPMSSRAVGEVAGELLERGGRAPDVVLVMTTLGHADRLTAIGRVLQECLAPTTLVGCASGGVVVPDGTVASSPTVVALAARIGPVEAMALAAPSAPGDQPAVASATSAVGEPASASNGSDNPELLVVLADRAAWSPSALCAWARRLPEAPQMVGAVVTGPAHGDGLLLGTSAVAGAVLLRLPASALHGATSYLDDGDDDRTPVRPAAPPQAGGDRTDPTLAALVFCPPGSRPARLPPGGCGQRPAALGCVASATIVPTDRGAAWHSETTAVAVLRAIGDAGAHHGAHRIDL
jgi:hypothetical protein